MTEPLPQDAESLDKLREEIDAVDAEMHRLLIRRGEVIERLIAAKKGAPTGSAFRPDREAAMLARLAARHKGGLPLATVEHIWREIIGTFTQLQAPFRIHAPQTSNPAMRDLLRFHFGFATPLVEQPSPSQVVAAVASSRADLGLVPLEPTPTAWWPELDDGPNGVKAIAVLPFLTVSDGWPQSLVLGPSAIVNPAADMELYAASCDEQPAPGRLSDDVEIIAAAQDDVLIACRGSAEDIVQAAARGGIPLSGVRRVGSYCSPPSQISGKT